MAKIIPDQIKQKADSTRTMGSSLTSVNGENDVFMTTRQRQIFPKGASCFGFSFRWMLSCCCFSDVDVKRGKEYSSSLVRWHATKGQML